eukprot:m.60541 g.60541  ORF g.60541 m.60541 type:complete len:127 (-) comp13851_c0_seq1:1077-1457(-)
MTGLSEEKDSLVKEGAGGTTTKTSTSMTSTTTPLTHWKLIDVVASLATTSLAYDLAGQAVTAGVARGRDHVNTLAAYVLARQLILWTNSISSPMEYVGLMLATSQHARQRILKYLLWIACFPRAWF